MRLAELAAPSYTVRRTTRHRPPAGKRAAFDTVVIGELGANTNWSSALDEVSIVFHLAARTHVLTDTAPDACAEYRRINVEGTRSLAYAAARAGVRRMVFLSSIKATGERTNYAPFTENTLPQPEDAYGVSKWEAEQALCAIARDAGLETVILRPPLIYGPGVKGNFLRLMRWVDRSLPIPFASVANRRSLIYVGNLVDALVTAGASPHAANKTFLVSDSEDVSTPILFQSIATAMHKRPRLLPCPPALLRTIGAALGKREEMQRITDSLQIDSSRIRDELGWRQRFTLAEGLARTSQWYDAQRHGR